MTKILKFYPLQEKKRRRFNDTKLSEEERATTLIKSMNGEFEKTIEIDFKSIYPAILYRMEDSPLPQGDLYDIEGFSRNTVKLSFKSSNFNIEGNKPLICGMTLGVDVG